MNTKTTAHPYLVQLKKQAKELKKAKGLATLTEAQFELAKSLGQASWPKLVLFVKQKDFHASIVEGDKDRFAVILAETPRLATCTFEDGSTPMLTAAEYDDPTMLEAIHKAGGKMRQRYEGSGHTPLSWAITCWSFSAAVKLLELGEKPDLFCAAGLGSVDLVKQFWPNGKLVAQPSQTGSSRYGADGKRLPCPPTDPKDQVSDALYIACRTGRTAVAEFLLEHGADPNFDGFGGGTCLGWAEFSRDPALTALLRKHGGRDDLADGTFGATPKNFAMLISVAWNFPVWKIRKWLEEEPEMVNASGDWGSVIHAAVESGNLEMLQTVLAFKPDLTARNRDGLTALEMATVLGRPEMVGLLV